MVAFKNIEITDKAWIDPLLKRANFRGAEYCFTNLFVWSTVYQTKVSNQGNWLFIRSGSKERPTDIFPAGAGDIKSAVDLLLQDALQERRDFRMMGVGADSAALLQQLYPGLFDITPTRDSWDYIYHVEDLSTLKGKRYQSKRNHIARFEELPDWSYEPLTPQNMGECIEMNKIWCQQMGCADDKSLYMETCAAELGLLHLEVLGLQGALLRVGNRVVAYTVGEPLNADTYIVHVEKAFHDVRGAYPMINRQFMREVGALFTYVNREDDAGDLGLRRAKNSYHPAMMVEKYFFAVSYNSLSLRL